MKLPLLSDNMDGYLTNFNDHSDDSSPCSTTTTTTSTHTSSSSNTNSATTSASSSSQYIDSTSSSRSSTSCSMLRIPSSASHQSEDSISAEVAHFEPIKRSPRTPPRPGTSYAPVLHVTPLNLNTLDQEHRNVGATSTLFQQKLLDFNRDKQRYVCCYWYALKW